jgi:hypothetical protein
MTPKEKANYLFEKFTLKPIKPIFIMSDEHAKQCALIAVDEIISLVGRYTNNYWEEVKHEIEKL